MIQCTITVDEKLFPVFLIDIGQLRLEISALEELSRQLFLEVHALRNMQTRQRWARTLQGKYFNVLGHFFSLYCLWKIFICTINIIFDRVGKKDPVTRGIEIAVHWCGLEMDIAFWSQHVSFFLVGCIVVTSIRGLLLTLTKVKLGIFHKNNNNNCRTCWIISKVQMNLNHDYFQRLI